MGGAIQGARETPIRAHPIPAAGRRPALDKLLPPGDGRGAGVGPAQVRRVRGRGQQAVLAVSERVVLREGVSGRAVEEAQASVRYYRKCRETLGDFIRILLDTLSGYSQDTIGHSLRILLDILSGYYWILSGYYWTFSQDTFRILLDTLSGYYWTFSQDTIDIFSGYYWTFSQDTIDILSGYYWTFSQDTPSIYYWIFSQDTIG